MGADVPTQLPQISGPTSLILMVAAACVIVGLVGYFWVSRKK